MCLIHFEAECVLLLDVCSFAGVGIEVLKVKYIDVSFAVEVRELEVSVAGVYTILDPVFVHCNSLCTAYTQLHYILYCINEFCKGPRFN